MVTRAIWSQSIKFAALCDSNFTCDDAVVNAGEAEHRVALHRRHFEAEHCEVGSCDVDVPVRVKTVRLFENLRAWGASSSSNSQRRRVMGSESLWFSALLSVANDWLLCPPRSHFHAQSPFVDCLLFWLGLIKAPTAEPEH